MHIAGGVAKLQDRRAVLLGCQPESRSAIVSAMLKRGPTEVTGFWLQLIVRSGIATLGLVVGGTAVIIGAVLIAPLMSPIVHLGMGFAVRSPYPS